MARSELARPIVDGTARALVPTTDRWLTVPNLLTASRLLAVPAFVYLLLGPHADGWALLVLVVSGWTDYVDGRIARRYAQISRLGQLLDPLVDRLSIAATVVALTVRGVLPLSLALLLLGRDLFVAGLLPVLRARGYGPLPVQFAGKAATSCLLYALPMLLLAAGDNPFAGPARAVGWAFAVWGTSLYWWSALLYAVQVRHLVAGAREGAVT